MGMFVYCFFFFKQKTAYEMRISDWSSDVCSSDLGGSNPPLSARFDKPPYGGFFVTGIHERRRRAPVIGIHGKVFSHVAACRSAAPALYPTPGTGPQPCTPASCICPYFPSPAPCGVLQRLGIGRTAGHGEDQRQRGDRKRTRMNSSHSSAHRMPPSA